MAKVSARRTEHGNLKIVLDPTSAQKLWVILSNSHLHEYGSTAHKDNQKCEDVSIAICTELANTGLPYNEELDE